jgi:lipid-A-disaccharide synthase-like uncharacterized protein
MNAYLVFGIGFLGQFLFFSRTILQWFKSENEGEIVSPVLFWKISLVASQLMLLYGILRYDFAIILGQFIVYFIYVRNLQLKNAWSAIPLVIRGFIVAVPLLIITWLITGSTINFNSLFRNEQIPLWLLLLGTAGQVVFSFRFIYQWIYSEKEKESVLPATFWMISIAGSLIIFIYSIFRLDPVLFISNLFGLFVYIRNVLICFGKNSLISRIQSDSIQNLSKRISDRIK